MTEKKIITVFAGKGGVGKTTCAAATALYYAGCGYRTLAISTDPTPSLADIFEVDGEYRLAKVNDCLHIREIGLDETKQMWDNKFGHEVYDVFSSFVNISYPEFVDFMISLLPGLRDEFMVDYIRELSGKDDLDVLIWDTAPLGQTLTLLETPAMLRQHLRMAPRIYSRLRVGKQSRKPVLEIIKRWEKLSTENIRFLQKDVNFCIVTIAEALAVNQLERVFAELGRYELKPGQLIVNNLVRSDGSAFLDSRAEEQSRYLKLIQAIASRLTIVEVPMFAGEIRGLDRLSEFQSCLFPSHESANH
ncbi:ArsA family ATPase [Chloroflexota bacterium]